MKWTNEQRLLVIRALTTNLLDGENWPVPADITTINLVASANADWLRNNETTIFSYLTEEQKQMLTETEESV